MSQLRRSWSFLCRFGVLAMLLLALVGGLQPVQAQLPPVPPVPWAADWADLTHAWMEAVSTGLLNGCAMEAALGVVVIPCHATGGDGAVGNPWTGWDTAIDFSLPNKTYWCPNGDYLQNGTVRVATASAGSATRGRIEIHCGQNARFYYNPTTDGTSAWTFGFTPTLSVGQNQVFIIDGLNIFSTDTTHFKIAIDMIDVSQVEMYGIHVPDPDFGGWKGNGSIYLRFAGREIIDIRDSTIAGECPIYLGGAVQEGFGGNLDIVRIANTFVLAGDHNITCPAIHFDPGVFVFQFSVDKLTCEGGSDCIKADVQAQIQWQHMDIHDMRWETHFSQPGYCLHVEFSGTPCNVFGDPDSGPPGCLPFGVQLIEDLVVSNLWCEGTNTHKGIKLRHVGHATITNYDCSGADAGRAQPCLDIGNADNSDQNGNAQHVLLLNNHYFTSAPVIKSDFQLTKLTTGPDLTSDRGITTGGPGLTYYEYVAQLPSHPAWAPQLHCSSGTNVHTYDTAGLPPNGYQGSYDVLNLAGARVIFYNAIFTVTAVDAGCTGFVQVSLPTALGANIPYSVASIGTMTGLAHQLNPAYTLTCGAPTITCGAPTITCASLPSTPGTPSCTSAVPACTSAAPSCTAALNTGTAYYTYWTMFGNATSPYLYIAEEGNKATALVPVASIHVPFTIAYQGYYFAP